MKVHHRLLTLLAALLVAGIWLLPRKQRSTGDEPTVVEKVTSKANPTQAATPPRPRSKDSVMEDLLHHVKPRASGQRVILYNGQEVLDVEGRRVFEDPVTGLTMVEGLRRVILSSGMMVESSDDGNLLYDPESGEAEIRSDSLSIKPPEK